MPAPAKDTIEFRTIDKDRMQVILNCTNIGTCPDIFIFPELLFTLLVLVMAVAIGPEDYSSYVRRDGLVDLYYPQTLGENSAAMYNLFTLVEEGYSMITLFFLLALILSDRPYFMQICLASAGFVLFLSVGVLRLVGTVEKEDQQQSMKVESSDDEMVADPHDNCEPGFNEAERRNRSNSHVQISTAMAAIELILAFLYLSDGSMRIQRFVKDFSSHEINLDKLTMLPSMVIIPQLLVVWILLLVFCAGHEGNTVFPVIATAARFSNGTFIDHSLSPAIYTDAVTHEPRRKLFCTLIILTCTGVCSLIFLGTIMGDKLDKMNLLFSILFGLLLLGAGGIYIETARSVIEIIGHDQGLLRDKTTMVVGGLCLTAGFLFLISGVVFFMFETIEEEQIPHMLDHHISEESGVNEKREEEKNLIHKDNAE